MQLSIFGFPSKEGLFNEKSKLPWRQRIHINTYHFFSQAFFRIFSYFFSEISGNFYMPSMLRITLVLPTIYRLCVSYKKSFRRQNEKTFKFICIRRKFCSCRCNACQASPLQKKSRPNNCVLLFLRMRDNALPPRHTVWQVLQTLSRIVRICIVI